MEYVAGEWMVTFRHLLDFFAKTSFYYMRIFIAEKVSVAKFLDWWLKDWCTLKRDVCGHFVNYLSSCLQIVNNSLNEKTIDGRSNDDDHDDIIANTFQEQMFFGDLCPNKYNLAVWASCPAVQTSHIGAIIFAPYFHIAHILGKLCNILSLSLLNTLVLSLRHTPTLPTYWKNFATSCHYLYWTL